MRSAPQLSATAHTTLTLDTGAPFLTPPRTPHNALDIGRETGMMLATYIVKVGKPLAEFTS